LTAPRRGPVSVAAIALAAAALLAVAPPAPGQQNDTLERTRLELDIARLEREAGFEARVQRWFPSLSVIVAAFVAGYGVLRYFDERRRVDEARIEDGITHNLEQLTERPSDANPNARAITALRALERFAPPDDGDKAAERRAKVTHAVTAIVSDDVTTIATRHDARLPIICLDHWPDFRTVAAGDRELCREVLRRYAEALAAMKVREPVYVPRVERRDGVYTAPKSLSGADALLFPVLVTGFERYLALMPAGEGWEEAAKQFTTSAEALGRQLFGARL
jgi:hypothetical protein